MHIRDKIMFRADALADETHSAISDAIARRRDQGFKRAVDLVARFYGLKPRRVIQYHRGEVRQPPAHEYLTIREKRKADLTAWMNKLESERAEIRDRLEQMGRQFDDHQNSVREMDAGPDADDRMGGIEGGR